VKGLPYLDGVVIEITPEANARLSLFRAGRVQLPHMWGFLAPEEAGYPRGFTTPMYHWPGYTSLGKFEKMAMGPALPGNDIDDWLYSAFYPEQPQNRSHVADAELNKMLIAQRRELDPKKGKNILD
jgi:hypothetical protein